MENEKKPKVRARKFAPSYYLMIAALAYFNDSAREIELEDGTKEQKPFIRTKHNEDGSRTVIFPGTLLRHMYENPVEIEFVEVGIDGKDDIADKVVELRITPASKNLIEAVSTINQATAEAVARQVANSRL